MKELSTIILRDLARGLGVLALCTFATVGTAFADNISKSFEFGAGLAQTRSNVRTFNLPCATEGGVAAVVKFKRLGPVGPGNDIQIIIEFREPDTAPGEEGPVVETRTAKATRTEQTVILRSQSSNRGCSLPWRVRVKHANEGTAPSPVSGSIRLDFDGTRRDVNVGYVGQTDKSLRKGEWDRANLGGSGGLPQGEIRIAGRWHHIIVSTLVPGPNPVKFRFELINPSGAVVRTMEAYSSDETSSSNRMNLSYQVTNFTPGQWKLKVTNIDDDDAAGITPAATFKPGCPN